MTFWDVTINSHKSGGNMKNETMNKHVKKVNKIVIISLWIILAMHLAYVFFNVSFKDNIMRSLLILGITLISMYFDKEDRYCGIVKYIISIGIMILAVTYNTFTIMTIFLMVGAICVSVMYWSYVNILDIKSRTFL